MAYGLQVWNDQGGLIVDMSTRICRIHGDYTVPALAAGTQTNVNVTGIANDGTWFMLPLDNGDTSAIGMTISSGFFTVRNSSTGTKASFVMRILRG